MYTRRLESTLRTHRSLKNGVNRPIANFEDNRLFSDVIWSDPSNHFPYLYGDNPRGRGYLFSTSAVELFLAKNSLKRIIRAHQCVKNGSASHFNEKCITVFSSSSYCKEMENKSGILKLFQRDDQIEFIVFPPLKRLQKSDAAYYKVQNLNKEMRKSICFSISHPKLTSNRAVRMNHVTHQKHHRGVSHYRSEIKVSHLPNLMFITNSRKKNVFIKKPICHSNSVDDFLSSENNNNKCNTNLNNNNINLNNNNINDSTISITKSMLCFNEKQNYLDEY